MIEFPDELDRVSFRATGLFWESKGVSRHMYPRDPKVELKMEKAESLARNKLQQKTLKREKELIPKLVEECAEWARKNGLKKLTKSSLELFLSEKEQALSRMSKDMIYNKVNLILAK